MQGLILYGLGIGAVICALIIFIYGWVEECFPACFIAVLVFLLGCITIYVAITFVPDKYKISQGCFNSFTTNKYEIDPNKCIKFNDNKICGSYTIEKND